MKKKPSVCEAWLIGLALVFLILFGGQTSQAQDIQTLPSLSGWVGAGMPYQAWTYASDGFDGFILTVSNSEKPCRDHHEPHPHRNHDRQRHQRKAHHGDGN